MIKTRKQREKIMLLGSSKGSRINCDFKVNFPKVEFSSTC